MAIIKKRVKVLVYGNLFGAYRSQNLIKHLLDSGYRVSFLIPEFYYERGIKRDFVSKVLRVLFSGFSYIELIVKAALADVVYVLPLNSNLIMPVLRVGRLFNTKVIVEMYISYFDTFVREQKSIASSSREARTIHKNEVSALTQSDYIIHQARFELKHFENLLNVNIDENKVRIAPLFCEPSLALMKSRMSQNHQGKLRICWWGTCIPTHGLDNILAALQKLNLANVDFTCTLFGIPPKGKEFIVEEYKNKIISLGLSDAVCLRQDLKFIDNSLPMFLVEHCDLALGLFGDMEKAKAAVPNKVIEALTLGIPTLTMKTPALDEFFDSDKDLWTCLNNPDDIARTITQIANGTIDIKVSWDKTRDKVLKTFCLHQYQQVIDQVINAAAAAIPKAKSMSAGKVKK